MNKTKALIGMSGGVDSSVAAHLMLQAGYDCIGGTMRLYDDVTDETVNSCCTLEHVEDARSVASRLGIPHYTFNFKEAFDRHVISNFIRCYECGMTPNPCIQCNKHLKFDALLQQARELGCEYVVSGHYAQIRQAPDTGRYLLYKAADTAKDQTYFLASLDQQQLAHILFPLGCLTKTEVREIAEANGFINARKRDSQDICFVPDGDYAAFMERYTGKKYADGDFLDLDGNIVGKHRGAVAYTLGQRKGLGIALGAPMYVCSKDMAANTVTVGPESALFATTLLADNWNWISIPALTEPIRVKAKARSRMAEQSATVYPEENGFARVEFDEPQRAITPGQSAVFYLENELIGGGIISREEA